ncbi:type II toxin-antitoxin system YafQ family toxin [uncultured Ellagibacter sp.]|uniref:type II toxin-antitoxin system YafQ family toxin n=1 Tax=uncultured Ellagibacter sp. TaxID=2137580 RepID=UPI0025F785B4|nr:type II toxin-antitoxin system YafQ family toxin [uncultured Ellagibacter sp.]
MLGVAFTSQFKKDMKRKRKQGAELAKIDEVITMLRSGEPLPERNRDHALSGTYRGHRECHIEPDWLLIYRIDSDLLVLTAVRTGSHSELLGI